MAPPGTKPGAAGVPGGEAGERIGIVRMALGAAPGGETGAAPAPSAGFTAPVDAAPPAAAAVPAGAAEGHAGIAAGATLGH